MRFLARRSRSAFATRPSLIPCVASWCAPCSDSIRGIASLSREEDEVETFRIICGSAGTVTVDIHKANLLTTPSTPLIVYLPPTGVHLRHLHPPRTPSLIFGPNLVNNSLRQLPIARINYRWNIPLGASPTPSHPPKFATHAFPTPLHDTLHAYTWLTTSFLPSFSSNPSANSSPLRSPSPYASVSSQTLRRPSLRPLLIYGSFVGGTLANSLSLTESRVRPVGSSIDGVIIHNGVFDWTHVATTRAPSLSASDQSASVEDPALSTIGREGWDLSTLHTLKTHLFSSPASAFDPFASPLLFFRSPGLSIPSLFPGTTPPPSPSIMHDDTLLDGLSLSEQEIASLRGRVSTSKSSSSSGEDEEITVSRRSALRFPPKDSGLRIPRSLFLTTDVSTESTSSAPSRKRARAKPGLEPGGEPYRQAEELARLMRRSVVMHEFKDRALGGDDADPYAASEERVQVRELRNGEAEREGAEVVEEWIAGLELE